MALTRGDKILVEMVVDHCTGNRVYAHTIGGDVSIAVNQTSIYKKVTR